MRLFILAMTGMLLVALCGCTGLPQETAASLSPTVETETPAPPTTVPTPTPDPGPFPGALAVGEVYTYGEEEELREVTVTRCSMQDSYQFLHPSWGTNYGTAQPARGNMFVFVFLVVEHKGTKKELGAPYPASVNVYSEGTFYSYRTDREGSVTKVLDYPGDEDYYGGIIHIYEKRAGFLIYEIPDTANPGEVYLQINLGRGLVPVWKLG